MLVLLFLLATFTSGLEPAFVHASSGSGGLTWSPPTAVTNDSYVDFKPHLLQAKDGRAWLFWELWNQTSHNLAIFYKTNDGASWSPSYRLTSDTGVDAAPSAAQLTNGTIVVAFSSNRTGTYSIFLKKYDGQKWLADVQITSSLSGDYSPSLLALPEGSLWLFWMRQSLSASDIYLKTYSQGHWSPDTPVTTNLAPNVSPSATLLKDGRILLTWARTIGVSEEQIFYKTYTSGTPSPEVQLTSKNWDENPDTIADRNGTVWIFWSRAFSYTVTGITGLVYQNEVMYSFSVDNIVSWSSPAQLTSDPKGFEKQDNDPTVIQSSNRTLWVAWSSDPDVLVPGTNETLSQWDIYMVHSNPLFVHDLAVKNVSLAIPSILPLLQYPGGLKSISQSPIVNMNITIANLGDFSETYTLSLSATNTTTYGIGAMSGSLPIGATATLSFGWNTTGVKPGKYGLLAHLNPIAGETLGSHGDDSLFVGSMVHVIPLGDVDQDGSVTIIDASMVALAFQSTPGTAHWNPYADFNANNIIDIIDVGVMAKNFGITT